MSCPVHLNYHSFGLVSPAILVGPPPPPHHLVLKMSATKQVCEKYYTPTSNKENVRQADKERKEVGAEPTMNWPWQVEYQKAEQSLKSLVFT